MSTIVTVNSTGKSYSIANPGEEQGWGNDLTALLKALTDSINTLLSGGDILLTTSTINNNVTSASNVNLLEFSPSTIRAANVNYTVYRTMDTSHVVETGVLLLSYDALATPKWSLTQIKNGDAGILFDITDLGQVTYTSTNLSVTGTHSGSISFSAKTLPQA